MKYIKYSLIAALGFLFVQCTEESDKTYPQQPAPQWSVVEEDFVSEAPAWQVAAVAPASAPGWRADFTGNASVPSWTDPDKSVYPMSMTAVVRLSPVLETLAADGDMMAAFIGGECRGVAKKVMNDGVRLFFIHVKAPSSENGDVEFRYYSAAAKRVYVSVASDVKYEVDKIYGTAENPAFPDFEQSGPFPVPTKAWVKVDKAQLPFTVAAGDELQAFVGGECRGIKHVESEADMLYCYDVLGRAEGEQVTYRYYSAEKKQVFVSEQSFVIGKRGSVVGSEDQPQTLSFVPQGSMTAYLTLDAVTGSYADKNGDKLAAFIGNVCAGMGEVVGEQDGRPVYKMVVNGVSSQSAAVDIRYYSHRNNYVFTAPACLMFADGKVEASPEQPLTVPLVVEGKHPLKMTACVALPQNIVRQATADDVMAAFVGTECRGMAKAEQAENGEYVFRMEINGSMGAEEPVTLKYYSTRNKYLYQAPSVFTFASGASYGTVSEPRIPSFVIVE
ncbi:hypothetical protein [Leyella stercorea]|uniref:hypothetical protein n=1 Tax=Leyella stercorea TaxID=363265 RepID=UPI003FEDA35E